jgi:hypothetical protein
MSTQPTKHTASLPRDNLRIKVPGWGTHKNFLAVKGSQLSKSSLEELTEARRLRSATDQHDTTEKVTEATIVLTGALVDGFEDGLIERKNGKDAIAFFRNLGLLVDGVAENEGLAVRGIAHGGVALSVGGGCSLGCR